MKTKEWGMVGAGVVLAGLSFMARGQTDTGFFQFVSILPLLVILGLLLLRVNMLIAGIAGGALAMILGGIPILEANKIMIDQVKNLMGIAVVPILNSAVAMAVFKSGGYTAALTLMRRSIGGNMALLAAFIVFLQAAATYMSGIGGGSAMVIAPLAFAAVGAIPEVIVGLSIAAAVCFTTSRASLESATVLKLSNIPVDQYANLMFPYMALFVVLAMFIAFVGTKRRGQLFSTEESEESRSKSNAALWKDTIPAIFLLLAVVLSPVINKAAGQPIVIPLVYTVITLALVGACTKLNFSQSCEALIDGSNYILTRLFQVALFLLFITLIEKTGAFNVIAGIARNAPLSLVYPATVLAGFLIGVPAGGYVATILGLILPVAVALNFPPLAIGFVTMAVGLGSQMCPVNITMQALSFGFQIPVMQVARGNSVWILPCLGLLMLLSFVLC